MLTKNDEILDFNYTIFSKKAFKSYYKFSNEDRFELKNETSLKDLSQESVSLDQIRKQEIFIKYLKNLTSKITRIYIQFAEKSLTQNIKSNFQFCEYQVNKEVNSLNINTHENNEKLLIKSIFLLETEEADFSFNEIDFNLMENDKKILDWEGLFFFKKKIVIKNRKIKPKTESELQI